MLLAGAVHVAEQLLRGDAADASSSQLTRLVSCACKLLRIVVMKDLRTRVWSSSICATGQHWKRSECVG